MLFYSLLHPSLGCMQLLTAAWLGSCLLHPLWDAAAAASSLVVVVWLGRVLPTHLPSTLLLGLAFLCISGRPVGLLRMYFTHCSRLGLEGSRVGNAKFCNVI
jgi:hypothetical protein